jgi:septum formation protein
MAPMVDEDAIKQSLQDEGLGPRDIADALAEAKATKLSAKYPESLVIGADQTLALDKGPLFDKPDSPDTAKAQLEQMADCSHRLFSAIVVAQSGQSGLAAYRRCPDACPAIESGFHRFLC